MPAGALLMAASPEDTIDLMFGGAALSRLGALHCGVILPGDNSRTMALPPACSAVIELAAQ